MNRPILSDHQRSLIQIIRILRRLFRLFFGVEYSNQCGFFLDHYLSREVHSFADWMHFEKGDRVLRRYSHPPRCAAVSNDGRYLFTGAGRMIALWDMADDSRLKEWTAHRKGVSALVYARGLLVSGSDNGSLYLWNGHTHQLILKLKKHYETVNSVAINQAGDLVVSASDDESVHVSSVKTGKLVSKFDSHTQSYMIRALFIDNQVLSADRRCRIHVWDALTAEVSRSLDISGGGWIHGVSMNRDQSLIAVAFGHKFTLLKYPELRVLRVFREKADDVQFHPLHLDLLAVTDRRNHTISLHNVSIGECTRVLKGHKQEIQGLCFTPCGSRLMSVSKDNTTRVWDLRTQ